MTTFSCDSNGYLLNSGSLDKIQSAYTPLLVETANLCREIDAGNLLAFYVRGSVAAGRAYIGSSDVDLVLITRDETLSSHFSPISFTEVFQHHVEVASEVDLTILPISVLISAQEYSRLRVYLRTQSVLLAGEDILGHLPLFRPDRSLAQYMHPHLEEELNYLQLLFDGDSGVSRSYNNVERPISFWCIWTMRTVLRAAGLLAMTRTNLYESDLRYCRDHASQVYPELTVHLQEAYNMALRPTEDAETISIFLKLFIPMFISLWNSAVINYNDNF